MQMIPMLQFLSPSRLWFLLLIPALVIVYLVLIRRQGRGRASAGPASLRFLIPKDRTWLRHLSVGLAVLSLMTLTVAFARPKQEVSVPRERATIVVAIDVSLSMEATDVQPNRLQAEITAASQFVTDLPPKFNVSLVTFAATADIVVPPTTDHEVVVAAIKDLHTEASTAIGEGIYSSLQALATVPPDPSHPDAKVPAVIVLMSDGSTQTGRPSDQAATEAKKQGVPIYCIAYGTPDGYIINGGHREPVPVDYSELARISRISGGRAYKAETASQLHDVYKDIGSSVGTEKQAKETTDRYAGVGLLFAVLAALGVASLAARWP